MIVVLPGLLILMTSGVFAYPQQLIPIVREVKTSSASPAEWNAFVQVMTLEGVSYISLAQAGALFEGELHWYPVSKKVELGIKGHTISFFYGSRRILLDGHSDQLNHSSIKTVDGFWVPASFFASRRFSGLSGQRLQWPPPAKKPEPRTSAPTPLPPSTPSPASAARPTQPLYLPRAKPAFSPLPPARSHRSIRRVVIDPGHGGKDPGTMSARGVEEKTLNLLMAQALADILRDRLGYEVLLTRTDDTFIPLEKRSELANHYNADLFISIHCNSSLSPKLRGFEVYFLSERASDPHADAVAKQENASLALEGRDSPSPRQLDVLLRSLVKNANINESSALGALVDRQVGQQLSEPRLGVQQAGFYVLRGAEMPAVLIETGFLSNKKEAKLLQDNGFRTHLIEGIVQGIDAYDERKQKEPH